MTAAQHRDQRLLDDLLLPEDDITDRGLGRAHMRRGRFRLPHDHVVEFFEHFAAHDSLLLSGRTELRSRKGVGSMKKVQHSGQTYRRRPTCRESLNCM